MRRRPSDDGKAATGVLHQGSTMAADPAAAGHEPCDRAFHGRSCRDDPASAAYNVTVVIISHAPRVQRHHPPILLPHHLRAVPAWIGLQQLRLRHDLFDVHSLLSVVRLASLTSLRVSPLGQHPMLGGR